MFFAGREPISGMLTDFNDETRFDVRIFRVTSYIIKPVSRGSSISCMCISNQAVDVDPPDVYVSLKGFEVVPQEKSRTEPLREICILTSLSCVFNDSSPCAKTFVI